MHAIRRLCLRGNVLYVCIPRGMAAALQWSPQEMLTVEVIGPGSVRVRPTDQPDLKGASFYPATFGVPREVKK